MAMAISSSKRIIMAYVAGVLVFLLVANTPVSIPCLFLWATGIPCPACGMTRAFISLAHFNLRQSFAYHPLFFLVPFLPFLYLERISNRLRDILAYCLLALVLVVWVIRLVFLFPYVSPMIYNENSLFEHLRRLVIYLQQS